MSPDEVLVVVAAAVNARGQLAPGMGSEQARAAAQRLLAALEVTTPDRPQSRELTAAPAPPPPANPVTREWPTVPPRPAAAAGRPAGYAVGRAAAPLPRPDLSPRPAHPALAEERAAGTGGGGPALLPGGRATHARLH